MQKIESMSEIKVQEEIREKRSSIKAVGTAIADIAKRFETDEDTRKRLARQIDHVNENFLFVIIGEVNAGKSSFVNALLHAPICATSHDICTQEVQKISYGHSEEIIRDTQEHITKRSFPAEILKEITIVDTPGTNSRELDHQVITENFIPLCNLVVFVFQVDNIHVQSAWDLFGKIKDAWTKKVIFVLTKADRYSEEEINNYSGTLRKYALESGVENPVLFVTSAKLEDEGKSQESGFDQIRAYINEHVLDTAAHEKISEDVKVLRKLLADIEGEFDLRQEKLDQDVAARQRIDDLMVEKEKLAFSNIDGLATRCMANYDRQTEATLSELGDGIGFFKLTFKSIRSIFGGETTKKWLEELSTNHVKQLNDSTNRILQDGVDAIKSDITYMVVGVKNELDALNQAEVKPFEMFRQLDGRRTELLQSLRTNLTDFIEKSPIFRGEALFDERGVDYKGVQVAGGIAAIGTAIAVISQGAVIDMTGGVATALGLLVAGGIAATQKGKYIRKVREALNEKKALFKSNLESNLKSYIDSIRSSINEQFSSFDQHLEEEKRQISSFREEADRLKEKLEAI